MKIIDVVEEVGKLEASINEYPFVVWSALFQRKSKPLLCGNQISFTDGGDFVSIEKARLAVGWLVDQLGGTVKWGKK